MKIGLISLVVLASCSGSGHRSPFGKMTPEARSAFLSYCSVVKSEKRGDDVRAESLPVPSGTKIDRPLVMDCEGQGDQRGAIGHMVLDEADDTVVLFSHSFRIPEQDFDKRLDAYVSNVIDPWIKVATHDQIVAAAKQSGDYWIRPEGTGWEIHTVRVPPPASTGTEPPGSDSVVFEAQMRPSSR